MSPTRRPAAAEPGPDPLPDRVALQRNAEAALHPPRDGPAAPASPPRAKPSLRAGSACDGYGGGGDGVVQAPPRMNGGRSSVTGSPRLSGRGEPSSRQQHAQGGA